MSTGLVIYLTIGIFLGAIEAYVSLYRGSSIGMILYCFFVNLFLWIVIQPIGFIVGYRRRSAYLKERNRIAREMLRRANRR